MSYTQKVKRIEEYLRRRMGTAYYYLKPHEKQELVRSLLRTGRTQ